MPVPTRGRVRVDPRVCGVCRTDLHLVEGDPLPKYRHIIPAHEVVVVGNVGRFGTDCTRFDESDRVGVPGRGRRPPSVIWDYWLNPLPSKAVIVADMPPSDESEMTITRQECLALLSQASVGRISRSIDALPVILPVHFGLFDESVLFCTTPGTELDIAAIGNVVAFQAYGELDEGTYWSVLLRGIASEVTHEWDGVRAASVWIKLGRNAFDGQRLVQVQARNISGRRFFVGGDSPSDGLVGAPQM